MKTQTTNYIDTACKNKKCQTRIGLEVHAPAKPQKCGNCGYLILVSQEERNELYQQQYGVSIEEE